jgi:hypothetical protein
MKMRMRKPLMALFLLASTHCFAADSAYSVLKADSKVGQYELAWEYDLDFQLDGEALAKLKEVPAGQTPALAAKVIDKVSASKLVSSLQPDQYPAAMFCHESRVIVITSAAITKYYTDTDCELLGKS